MSPNKRALLWALLLTLLPPAQLPAGQEMSRVIAGQPELPHLEPRPEVPPYSPTLSPENHRLAGLGPTHDSILDLANKSLEDVLAVLGPARLTHTGENDVALLCYLPVEPADHTAVVFSFYPDILVGVDIHSDRRRILKAGERCTPSASVDANIRTAGGLRLGLTRAEVVRLLGKPHRVRNNRLEYASQRPASPGESASDRVIRDIRVWLDRHDRVIGLSILGTALD